MKKILLLLFSLVFFFGLIWLHRLNRAEDEQEAEAPIASPTKLTQREGAPPILELSKATIEAAGIEAELFSSAIAQIQFPPSSIVREQGRAWVYLRVNETQFEREEVEPLSNSENGHWRLSVPQKSPLPVVTKGAEILLSEELKSSIQVGEDAGG